MNKTESYQAILKGLQDWEPYLRQESGLPGPRGNLELARVVVDLGDRELFERLLAYTPEKAPTNSPEEFLAFCGVVGLGKLVAQGDLELLSRLRLYASDPRWRTREAVAMALQRLGDVDMPRLLEEMRAWSRGNWLEKRAAAAALAEPSLLTKEEHAMAALAILDDITGSIVGAAERGEDFKTLRKGLGYCWSVVVAAIPDHGKQRMEKWLADGDEDIHWIIKENLKKNRLLRLDPEWVQKLKNL